MKSIAMIRTKNPLFPFFILLIVSLSAAYGEVVLNTIYALVSTKNNLNFISRLFINLAQLIASSTLIFYLTNTFLFKLKIFEIKEKVGLSKIIESRWPALFLIIPIIANNHFLLIERSLFFALAFAIFILLYLYFQSKNYLSLINVENGGLFVKKNFLYLASLLISDLVLIELIQLARRPLGI